MYGVFAAAENGAESSVAYAPATRFWTTSAELVRYALYQLLASWKRSRAPMLVLAKELTLPVKRTSASLATGPRVALKLPALLDTTPALPVMENAALVAASRPQACPSEAVPQCA